MTMCSVLCYAWQAKFSVMMQSVPFYKCCYNPGAFRGTSKEYKSTKGTEERGEIIPCWIQGSFPLIIMGVENYYLSTDCECLEFSRCKPIVIVITVNF